MIGVGAALVMVLAGQYSGCGHAAYSYTPSYNYSYGYNQAYSAPYIQTKLTVVATEPDYGGYGGLLGQDARYALKDKADQEFKTELLAVLKALKEKPAPAPEIQTFQAPQYMPQQQPQYVPQQQYAPAPAYGPSPQSPVQAAPQQPQQYVPPQQPQQPLYAPQVPQKALQVPGKGPAYSPAPLPPQVPQPNPQAGDWGTSSPSDNQQTLTSILGNRCAACHSSDNPNGGLAVADAEGNPLSLNVQQLSKAYKAVALGRMPRQMPGVPAMQPNERAALEDAIVFMFQTASR